MVRLYIIYIAGVIFIDYVKKKRKLLKHLTFIGYGRTGQIPVTMKKALLLVLFLVLVSSTYAYPMTIKYTTASSPRGFMGFWDINFIIIYDVDELSEYELNQILVHEYTHQLCWELFGVYPKNVYDHDSRCFTGEGSLLIS